MGETIPFGDQHLDELATARQERIERPEGLVGKRPDGRVIDRVKIPPCRR
jgi:hypothetical protein